MLSVKELTPFKNNKVVQIILLLLTLQYHGISLLSTIYKLYAGILNNRLVTYLEDNNIYVEEQNGFRQNRSSAEDISY